MAKEELAFIYALRFCSRYIKNILIYMTARRIYTSFSTLVS